MRQIPKIDISNKKEEKSASEVNLAFNSAAVHMHGTR